MSERSWLRRRGGSRAELSRAGQLLRAAPQQRAAVRSLARSALGRQTGEGTLPGRGLTAGTVPPNSVAQLPPIQRVHGLPLCLVLSAL